MEIFTQQDGATVTVKCAGRFTFDDQKAFKQLLSLFEKDGVAAVAFDLSGLEYADSAAFGMLMIAREKAQDNRRRMVLQNPKGQVKKLFDLGRFDQFFTIQES